LFIYFFCSQVNRQNYVVSDPTAREKLKQQIEPIANDMNTLHKEQKLMKDQVANLKRGLKEATDEADCLKKSLGRTTRQITNEIESIFSKNYIERPYYHGGKYNGKAMVHLMDYSHSSKIMDQIAEHLLTSIPDLDASHREEINEWIPKFKKVLSVFDGAFSISRMPSGTASDEHIIKLESFIATALKLWRGLGNSITPKVHAIEDHLVEQIWRLKGIGDLSEDFIEKSHQDGIIDHSRTENSLSHDVKARQHSHREHKRLLPSVQCHAKHIGNKTKRCKTIRHENGTSSKILITKIEVREKLVKDDKKKGQRRCTADSK
jgi:cell division septum initiation protein DivIVA